MACMQSTWRLSERNCCVLLLQELTGKYARGKNSPSNYQLQVRMYAAVSVAPWRITVCLASIAASDF